MEIYLLSFIVIAILFAGMAIGVIVANKPVKGSCGGMSALGIDTECDICGGNPAKCEEENAQAGSVTAADKVESVGNAPSNTVANTTSEGAPHQRDLAYNAAEKK